MVSPPRFFFYFPMLSFRIFFLCTNQNHPFNVNPSSSISPFISLIPSPFAFSFCLLLSSFPSLFFHYFFCSLGLATLERDKNKEKEAIGKVRHSVDRYSFSFHWNHPDRHSCQQQTTTRSSLSNSNCHIVIGAYRPSYLFLPSLSVLLYLSHTRSFIVSSLLTSTGSPPSLAAHLTYASSVSSFCAYSFPLRFGFVSSLIPLHSSSSSSSNHSPFSSLPFLFPPPPSLFLLFLLVTTSRCVTPSRGFSIICWRWTLYTYRAVLHSFLPPLTPSALPYLLLLMILALLLNCPL